MCLNLATRPYSCCLLADCRQVFALIVKQAQETESMWAFSLVDCDVSKGDLVTLLCRTIANAICRTNCVRVAVLLTGVV